MGPDLDIGNSPILKTLAGGKRALIVGTKRGHVIAIDPDNNGARCCIAFSHRQDKPLSKEEVAAAPLSGAGRQTIRNVYYGAGGSGLAALRLATGEKAWTFTAPAGGGSQAQHRPLFRSGLSRIIQRAALCRLRGGWKADLGSSTPLRNSVR
jgi:hypothetical protein